MKLNKKTIIIFLVIVVVIVIYFRWQKYKVLHAADQVATGANPDSPVTSPSIIDFVTAPITGSGSGGSVVVDPIADQMDKKGILDTWLQNYNITLPQNVYDMMLAQPKNLLEQYSSYSPTEMINYINYLQQTGNSNQFLDNVKAVLIGQGYSA